VLSHSVVTLSESQGVMEVGSSCVGPGKASRGVWFGARSVVHGVGEDHFQNLLWESTPLSIHRGVCAIWNPECECTVSYGFGPTPYDERTPTIRVNIM
jgi:hypothetical protein